MGIGACVAINYEDCMAENRIVLEANQCKAHRVIDLVVATESEWLWWKLERHAIDRQQCFARRDRNWTGEVCGHHEDVSFTCDPCEACEAHCPSPQRKGATIATPPGITPSRLKMARMGGPSRTVKPSLSPKDNPIGEPLGEGRRFMQRLKPRFHLRDRPILRPSTNPNVLPR